MSLGSSGWRAECNTITLGSAVVMLRCGLEFGEDSAMGGL